MSTTSCPHCSAQVTLPVGVSNSAKVRCPLCDARYTLADALVNMPPLLEVVEDSEEASGSRWPDESSTDELDLGGAELAATQTFDFRGSDDADEMADEGEPLDFVADEAAADDLAMDDKDSESDTEVEEQSFSTFDSVEPPDDAEVAAEAGEDDGVLDLGPTSASAETLDDEMTLEFSEAPADDEDAELEPIEFGEPETIEAAEDLEFDLDDQRQTAGAGDATIEFESSEGIDFESDEPAVAALGEFGDTQFEPAGEDEEIPLDMTAEDEPAAVVAAEEAEETDEEAGGKKKRKKKKDKKVKAVAADGEAKPKRSLVGTLARVGLPALVALMLVAYIPMWISPAWDVLGVGNLLPKFLVPADYAKYKNSHIAQTANRTTLSADDMMAKLGSSPAAQAFLESRGQGEADEPAVEEPAADEAPSLDPNFDATPAEPVADPFGDPPADEAPTETGVAAPADDPFGADQPADMPADGADEPADTGDPFGADQPADMPAEGADAPADTGDPFGDVSAPELPPAGDAPAEDPFGGDTSASAAEDPFGDTATEPAAPAEPFGLDAPEPAPAVLADEADPFATPAAPADEADPFAPTGGAEDLPAPDESAVALGPKNVAEVSLAEVMVALQATQAAGQEMLAAEGADDEAQLRKAKTNFYVKLFEMANAITIGQLGPTGEQLAMQMKNFEPMVRDQLASDPKRVDALKVFGARWFGYSKRPNNGVVMAGTVESVDQVGPLYHIKVRPGAEAAEAVTIVSANDPGLASGDEVLTLGSIVEQPAEQLGGYEGSEPAVVWSGMTMKMPASATQ